MSRTTHIMSKMSNELDLLQQLCRMETKLIIRIDIKILLLQDLVVADEGHYSVFVAQRESTTSLS